MKHIKSSLIAVFALFLSIFSLAGIASPTPAYARRTDQINSQDAGVDSSGEGFSCRTFLGMISWDCGLQNFDSSDDIPNNIIIIASNVLTDISIASAYLVLGFVIYGGFLYMFSSGDAARAANGKKTLTRAFIGLAIILSSNVILTAIRVALLGNDGSLADSNISPDQIFTNAINWILGIASVVCIVFIVIGAVGYITSTGDPGKVQKAKNTLIYALIGLAVVGLSAAITAFVSGIIRDAANNATSYDHQTLIAKEYHELN